MIPFLALLLGNDLTPSELKTAMEPIKTEFSSQGSGHFFMKLASHLTNCTKTEVATLAGIRSKLEPHMCEMFDKTYKKTKNRYLNPLENIPPWRYPHSAAEEHEAVVSGTVSGVPLQDLRRLDQQDWTKE